MSATTHSDMLSEIKEVNLSYLLLAQRLLREDRAAGMFRMGISERLADVLAVFRSRRPCGSPHRTRCYAGSASTTTRSSRRSPTRANPPPPPRSRIPPS